MSDNDTVSLDMPCGRIQRVVMHARYTGKGEPMTEGEQTAPQYVGRGYIGVSAAVYPLLGSPDTPEQWKGALLLPDDYKIERVEHVAERGLYHVFVQHASIPPFGDYEPMPEVMPVYRKDYTEDQMIGKVVLDRIEVWDWDGEHRVQAN